jgi:hypothetical protein
MLVGGVRDRDAFAAGGGIQARPVSSVALPFIKLDSNRSGEGDGVCLPVGLCESRSLEIQGRPTLPGSSPQSGDHNLPSLATAAGTAHPSSMRLQLRPSAIRCHCNAA